MNCPTCDRTNPADAQFCIYCATRLQSDAPEVPVINKPAVGPTKRLTPPPTPTYTMPTPAPQPAPQPLPQASSTPGHHAHHWNKDVIGAVFLIGLGVLFLTGNLFPGILVLLGVTGYMREAAQGRPRRGLRSLVFFSGLAVLFATHFFFPGILLLFGLLYLIGSEGRRGGWHWC